MKENSFRCEKDEEIGYSRKIQGKRSRLLRITSMARCLSLVAPFETLLAFVLLIRNEALEMGVTMSMIPNFRYGGPKGHDTIILTNIGVSLGDDFVDDIESCSTESANLE